jgi:hypothetical protein
MNIFFCSFIFLFFSSFHTSENTLVRARSVNHSVRTIIVEYRHTSVLHGTRDRCPGVRSRVWHQQGIIKLIDCSGGLWWQRSSLRFRRVT